MARTWLQIKVELIGGRGDVCDSPPGRVFIVGPAHTFEQFAHAINAAFARWDLSHLHQFELADGRLIGYPDDSYEPVASTRSTRSMITEPRRPARSRSSDGDRSPTNTAATQNPAPRAPTSRCSIAGARSPAYAAYP